MKIHLHSFILYIIEMSSYNLYYMGVAFDRYNSICGNTTNRNVFTVTQVELFEFISSVMSCLDYNLRQL